MPSALLDAQPGSVVYVVQDTENGWVKIGHSSCLKKRLPTLRSQPRRKLLPGPCGPLLVLASFPRKIRLEKHYQRAFAAEQLDGEWFSPSERLMAFAVYLRGGVEHADAFVLASTGDRIPPQFLDCFEFAARRHPEWGWGGERFAIY